MQIVGKTKSDIKSGLKHPIALLLFGMLFAAFLFPMIASFLGKTKASGGVLSRIIPQKFTKTA